VAKELQAPIGVTGYTVYAVIRDAVGQVYAGTAAEEFDTANWGTYVVPLTEQGATGYYVGDFPPLASGVYFLEVRRQTGGTPAAAVATDPLRASGWVQWSGSAILPLAGLPVLTRNAVTGGAYALSTDATGRVRVAPLVSGTYSSLESGRRTILVSPSVTPTFSQLTGALIEITDSAGNVHTVTGVGLTGGFGTDIEFRPRLPTAGTGAGTFRVMPNRGATDDDHIMSWDGGTLLTGLVTLVHDTSSVFLAREILGQQLVVTQSSRQFVAVVTAYVPETSTITFDPPMTGASTSMGVLFYISRSRLVTPASVRTAVGLASANLDTQLADARKLLEADQVIRTDTTPWRLEYREKGTATVLLSKDLKQLDGSNLIAANVAVGQKVQP
jgi:hypothetical protein